MTTLVGRLDRQRFRTAVICIGREGELFASLGTPVPPSPSAGRSGRPCVLADLVRSLRGTAPDVVVLRGYNAELLGRVAAVLARVPHSVVWVHNCGDLAPRGRVRRVADPVLDPVTDAYFGVAQRRSPTCEEIGVPARKVRIDPQRGRSGGLRRGGHRHQAVWGWTRTTWWSASWPRCDRRRTTRRSWGLPPSWPRRAGGPVPRRRRRCPARALEARRTAGISDRVVFSGTGTTSPLSSQRWTCSCSAPSRSSASRWRYSRPWPGSARRCARPSAEFPEIIEDGMTGYLVPHEDPARARASACSTGSLNPRTRRQFGVAARARVEAAFTLGGALPRGARPPDPRPLVAGPVDPRPGQPAVPVRLTVIKDETSHRRHRAADAPMCSRPSSRRSWFRVADLPATGRSPGGDFRAAGFEVRVLERRGRFDADHSPRLIKLLRDGRDRLQSW